MKLLTWREKALYGFLYGAVGRFAEGQGILESIQQQRLLRQKYLDSIHKFKYGKS